MVALGAIDIFISIANAAPQLLGIAVTAGDSRVDQSAKTVSGILSHESD